MKKLKLVGAILAIMLATGGSAVETKNKSDSEKAQAQSNLIELEFAAIARKMAISDPQGVMSRWMQPGAYKKWQELTAEMFDGKNSPELSDFFTTSLVLLGPQNNDTGIVALYSPWQDAILILQTDNSDPVRKIEDFVFLPGSMLRDEQNHDKFAQSVFPTETPLSVALWKLYDSSVKKFESTFPLTAEPGLKPVRNFDAKAALKAIRKNSLARFGLLMKLLDENNTLPLAATMVFTKILRDSNQELASKQFQPGLSIELLESFYKLSPEIRKGLTLYFYLANDKQELFAFSHVDFTRLVVIIAQPKDDKSQPAFEFFDFNSSPELLNSWQKTIGENKK